MLASCSGGVGGVSLVSQLLGTGLGVLIALMGGFAVYGALKLTVGIRLDPEEEFNGADITIHKITTVSNEAEGGF